LYSGGHLLGPEVQQRLAVGEQGGSGAARSWIDLANAVFPALGKKPKIEFIEMPETIRDKYQYFTEANILRLRAAGYKAPVMSLEAAVADYVRNYLVPDKRLEPA
jgi:ADP-L-glycero-D-manno-heptose 6-epimerase